MKRLRLSWEFYFGLSLVLLSAIILLIHYLIFKDSAYLFMYMIEDIGLLPLNVLVVTIGLQQIMDRREKQLRLNKMHMVIGAFFSEVGTELMKVLASFDHEFVQHRTSLLVNKEWLAKHVRGGKPQLSVNFHLDSTYGDMNQLKERLLAKKDFLLRLLENPNLLEHDAFTDMLWAVFHLAEELACREKLTTVSKVDMEHLSGDMKRAFDSLLTEWLIHLKYLSAEYPYLFSLAVRTNPFDPEASVELQ